MALDGNAAAETPVRAGPLQGVLSTALASVSGVCGRLGLGEQDHGFPDGLGRLPLGDPHREKWAIISGDVVSGAESAAFAAGLHHQAAAELDDIERELAAIAALVCGAS